MKRAIYISLLCAALCVTAAGAVATEAEGGAVVRTEQPAATGATAQGGTGHIVFAAGEADATFSVYSITGQLLRTVRVAAGTRATVDVPKGFYIVRCGRSWSRKVVVK